MRLVYLERESVGTDIDDACFERFGEVIRYPAADTAKTAERVKDADIILCNKTPLNEKTLGKADRVRLIAELATGYDNIDLAYCQSRGIAVCNVPSYATSSVAQHTFMLASALMGHLLYYNDYVKSGSWSRQDGFSHFAREINELAGKTWGIIGMGNIGRKVKTVAEAFGAKVINTPSSDRPLRKGEVDLATLLKEADIVSLHCPLSERTFHLMNGETLSMMKPTAILINVARGKCVDERALYDALVNNRIRAAGLDVTESEPLAANSPLLSFADKDRLIITPHNAWASLEARKRDIAVTWQNIESFLSGGKLNRVI